jgi:hypothetical protein
MRDAAAVTPHRSLSDEMPMLMGHASVEQYNPDLAGGRRRGIHGLEDAAGKLNDDDADREHQR